MSDPWQSNFYFKTCCKAGTYFRFRISRVVKLTYINTKYLFLLMNIYYEVFIYNLREFLLCFKRKMGSFLERVREQ